VDRCRRPLRRISGCAENRRIEPERQSCCNLHSPAARNAVLGTTAPVSKRSGLDLSSRDGLLRGGDTGPAVVPGNPGRRYKQVSRESARMHFNLPGFPRADRADSRWIDAGFGMMAPECSSPPHQLIGHSGAKASRAPSEKRSLRTQSDRRVHCCRARKRQLRPHPPAHGACCCVACISI
jgi:hypothetical protein